jgi:hypothetical protein
MVRRKAALPARARQPLLYQRLFSFGKGALELVPFRQDLCHRRVECSPVLLLQRLFRFFRSAPPALELVLDLAIYQPGQIGEQRKLAGVEFHEPAGVLANPEPEILGQVLGHLPLVLPPAEVMVHRLDDDRSIAAEKSREGRLLAMAEGAE